MKNAKIIDLTMPISPDMPVYPGDPVPGLTAWGEPYSDDFLISQLKLGTHTGTHADAPLHRFKDKEGISEMHLAKFVGMAVVVDCSGIGPGVQIDTADLLPHQSGIAECKKVLFRTDWLERSQEYEIAETKTDTAKNYDAAIKNNTAYFHRQPGLSREAARWLVSQNVELIGLDLPSVNATDNEALHAILLEHGVVIIENLIGLNRLTRNFVEFHAAPLLIDKADGSPVRAYAIEK